MYSLYILSFFFLRNNLKYNFKGKGENYKYINFVWKNIFLFINLKLSCSLVMVLVNIFCLGWLVWIVVVLGVG